MLRLAGFNDVGERSQHGPRSALIELVEGWLASFRQKQKKQACRTIAPDGDRSLFCGGAEVAHLL